MFIMFLDCASLVLVALLALVIKLWLKNQIFTFLTSLKPPADVASYYARRFPRPSPLQFVKIIVKVHLQAFWQNFEN